MRKRQNNALYLWDGNFKLGPTDSTGTFDCIKLYMYKYILFIFKPLFFSFFVRLIFSLQGFVN